MEIPLVTPMLALYRSDQPSYQPTHTVPLRLEDGAPQASLENLERLHLVIEDIRVRKGLRRVLIQFTTGEQYVALGLSNPETLAAVAVKAGWGDLADLTTDCRILADTEDGDEDDGHYDNRLPRN